MQQLRKQINMRSEALIVVNIKIMVYWEVMLYSLVDTYQHYRGTYLPNYTASHPRRPQSQGMLSSLLNINMVFKQLSNRVYTLCKDSLFNFLWFAEFIKSHFLIKRYSEPTFNDPWFKGFPHLTFNFNDTSIHSVLKYHHFRFSSV